MSIVNFKILSILDFSTVLIVACAIAKVSQFVKSNLDPFLIVLNSFFDHTVLHDQVRVTNLEDATEHIGEVLKRVKKEHLERAYKIKDW